MKILLTVLIAAMLSGCLAKHSRILNEGEKTLVSDDVHVTWSGFHGHPS